MHLTTQQLELLRVRLTEEQKKLRDVLASLEATNPINDTDRENDNETGADASETGDMDLHTSLERESRILLTRVEEALVRIEDGSYGHTVEGQEIPFARLQVDPTATTLVSNA